MTLEFLPNALEVYKRLKMAKPEEAEKIKALLKEIILHPETGSGAPVQLQGTYSGVWERHFSFNGILYYVFNEEKVLVLSLSSETGDTNEKIGTPPMGRQITVESFSDEEYASVMALMAANRGKDSEPKVGIFWYNRARNELFGVVSHKVSDYTKANASDGRITCSEMHEDIWKREFRRQKYHGDGNGPYVGAYQDKPRGRVFYNIESDQYEIAVGKWFEECPQAYRLILDEFDLPKEKTSVKYAIY